MKWHKAATLDALQINNMKNVFIEGRDILLISYNDEYYAIENHCSHDGGELLGGELEGNEIVCPRHGARFCLLTGAVTAPPAYEDIEKFNIKIEENIIWVEL